MRVVCRATRILGTSLALAALAAFGWDLHLSFQAGVFTMSPAGKLWFELHAPSLNALQAGVQRQLWPWLWDGVLFPLLTAPAWLLLGIPGALLVRLGRR